MKKRMVVILIVMGLAVGTASAQFGVSSTIPRTMRTRSSATSNFSSN